MAGAKIKAEAAAPYSGNSVKKSTTIALRAAAAQRAGSGGEQRAEVEKFPAGLLSAGRGAQSASAPASALMFPECRASSSCQTARHSIAQYKCARTSSQIENLHVDFHKT